MQCAAAAPGAAGDTSRFEDASESEGLEAAASVAGERATDGDVAAEEDEVVFSDEEDEALLAEALEWDFCEGALACAWRYKAAERAH
jgi:hypothetical protein